MFNPSASEDDIVAVDADAEEIDFEILRTKTLVLKPETPDEAILQMNMLGHQFYVFLNAETTKINVAYRRKDGGYGIIEPEIE